MKVISYGYNGVPRSPTFVAEAVGHGWEPLVLKLIDDLFEMGWNGSLLQIKEKFGGLRFYIGSGTGQMFERISIAEEDSFKVCQECGQPGEPKGPGWILTLCQPCRDSRQERRNVVTTAEGAFS